MVSQPGNISNGVFLREHLQESGNSLGYLGSIVQTLGNIVQKKYSTFLDVLTTLLIVCQPITEFLVVMIYRTAAP